jgi:hypothetical protein
MLRRTGAKLPIGAVLHFVAVARKWDMAPICSRRLLWDWAGDTDFVIANKSDAGDHHPC